MKKAILYVDMVDTARIALANEPAGHRIVGVELTGEQIELIIPRKTGGSGNFTYYEEVHPISIQEEKCFSLVT